MAEAIARRYGEATKALVRSIEEARLENRKHFEILSDLIRGMTTKKTTPSVVLGDGVRSSERNQPRRPKEDDRGHLEDDSQTICDKDFALEIDETEEPPQEIVEARDPTIFWGINIDSERPTLFKKFGTELDGRASKQKIVVEPKEHSEVITYPLKIVVEVESDEIDGTQGVFTANRKNLFDVRMNLSKFLGISSAYKVFVEMPGLGMVERGTNVSSWIVELSPSIAAVIGKQKALDGNLVFDPGGGLDVPDYENDECRVVGVVLTDRVDYKPSIGALFSLQCIKDRLILMPFDRGRSTAIPIGLGGVGVDSYIGKRLIMVFDPGGDLGFLFVLPGVWVFV